MTIAINSSKSGAANLYDLLNAANPGKGFTPSNVSFGNPVVRVEAGDNTSVTITALSNQGYSGAVTRTYMRRNPGAAHGKTGSMKVLISPSDTQMQIRDKVLAAVGCIGSEVSVAGNGAAGAFNIPANEDDTSCIFTLTPNANSYVYVGTFTAQLTVPDTDIPLSTAVPNTSLGGFTAA